MLHIKAAILHNNIPTPTAFHIREVMMRSISHKCSKSALIIIFPWYILIGVLQTLFISHAFVQMFFMIILILKAFAFKRTISFVLTALKFISIPNGGISSRCNLVFAT